MDVVRCVAVAVLGQVPLSQTDTVSNDGRIWLWIALSVGVLALVAAFVLARSVIAADTGTPDVQVISNAISAKGLRRFCGGSTRRLGRSRWCWP